MTANLPEHRNVCTSEECHVNADDEKSNNSLACLAPDVLIVRLNILLKCQLASGEWQSDKTDADRKMIPPLTFLIPILPLKTSFHLHLMSWPKKGQTYTWRLETTGKLHQYAASTFKRMWAYSI